MNVQYNPNVAREPGEKYHRVKYALRPIFRDVTWDEELAYGLRGLRRMQAWGRWNGPAVWDAPESESLPSEVLIDAVAGCCPVEGLDIA